MDEKTLEEVQNETKELEEPDFRTTYKSDSENAFKHLEHEIDEFTPYESNRGFDDEDEIVDDKERCISVDRGKEAQIKESLEEPSEQEVRKKRGRPKGKAKVESKKFAKKRGRPPKNSGVELKTMAETLEKHMRKDIRNY